ncbi:hypothetical protein [Rhodohalobacter sp.]|uniref:hypothetical protein n=1 Tax=Rhodohalobacter sp. TaxID=1974210 RepID=UPI00356265D0
MIDNSNKSEGVEGSKFVTDSSNSSFSDKSQLLVGSVEAFVSYVAATLQIITGVTIIVISILGMISPMWFSAILSILGSVSCMTGVFLFYFTSANEGSIDGLINQAIRRVINSQN